MKPFHRHASSETRRVLVRCSCRSVEIRRKAVRVCGRRLDLSCWNDGVRMGVASMRLAAMLESEA